MSRLERVQIHFHTTEGELVTTSRMTFGDHTDEYLTISSIAFLKGVTDVDIAGLSNRNDLIMNYRHGQKWFKIKDALFLLGLTPDAMGA